MLWDFKYRWFVLALVAFGLCGSASGVVMTLAAPECGQAQLDNDLDERDIETYCADPELDAGAIRTTDVDGDGDFDEIIVGIKGGGSIYGWDEFDGRPEVELIISDPTLPSARVRTADADADGDADVIWVGTQGLDLDADGDFELDEAGLIAGFVDMDGDGDMEIAVADKSRSLGDYYVGGFGLDRESPDRFEVIWVGMLNEQQRAAIGSIVKTIDIDSDGDDEVLVEDLSRLPKEVHLDVDLDGDVDIIISKHA